MNLKGKFILRLSLLCGICISLSSCAFLAYKKGLLNSSTAKQIREYQDNVYINIDPPLKIEFRPKPKYYYLLEGLCIFVPLPLIPSVPQIIAAIKHHRAYEIPSQELSALIEFQPYHSYSRRLKTKTHYSFSPQQVQLLTDNKTFYPKDLQSNCVKGDFGSIHLERIDNVSCNIDSAGRYSFFMSSASFVGIPKFTLTFDVFAPDIKLATLNIGNVVREGISINIPQISIKRRSRFNWDCAL